MSSEFGSKLKITVFGESHGAAVGMLACGFPRGEAIDKSVLMRFMDRRRPKADALSTGRIEQDLPIFLSGIKNNVTCGEPILALIANNNARSADYDALKHVPRPSHADYCAYVKYGIDTPMQGGGQFSGRLTAPLCVAGGIAIQMLARRGICIGSHIFCVADVFDAQLPLFPTRELFDALGRKSLPVIDDAAANKMAERILEARNENDSVGGVIECAVIGLPTGLGGALFGGVDCKLSAALFGVPAVRGVEFGSGFSSAHMRGSENNDAFEVKNGTVVTATNRHGGLLGGITSGMPLLLRAAIKPTPSISKEQQTVDLDSMTNTSIAISGRHDPCIAVRAAAVIEAVTAITIMDIMLEEGKLT